MTTFKTRMETIYSARIEKQKKEQERNEELFTQLFGVPTETDTTKQTTEGNLFSSLFKKAENGEKVKPNWGDW
jgi:hypothetical protein